MVWSLVREQGFDQVAIRRRIRERYGKQLEYLTRSEASEVITMLMAATSANHVGRNDDPSHADAGHTEPAGANV
jgi:hypothetical protein